MPAAKIIEDLVSIVLVGNFNPAIFQPAWFAAKELIRESEATGATVEVIHPEIAQFRAGWLHISVTTTKFVASTKDAAHRAPLRDLVVSTFELLDQTPTSKLGLNRAMHVDLGNEDTWHALGHLVAPKQPWADILEKPGTRVLLMEGHRKDGRAGRTFVRVEPSQKFPHAAFIDVNSEYVSPEPDRPSGNTAYFVSRIREDWDRILLEAQDAVDRLVRQVLPAEKQ